jgi:putative flippase GtrA
VTLARYILVQIVAYAFDLCGFYALYRSGIAGPVAANFGGKLVAGLFAFFAHRSFTFRLSGAEDRLRHAVKYFTLLALNAPISSAILAGLILYTTHITIAKILADVLSTGITFLLTKHLVFQSRKLADPPSTRERTP